MAVSELQTLQNLYKSGATPQTPIVMSWRPLEEDLDRQVRTLDMIQNYKVPMDRMDRRGSSHQPERRMKPINNAKATERKGDSSGASGDGGGGLLSRWNPFKKEDRKGEEIWLESYAKFPGAKKKKIRAVHHHHFYGGQEESEEAPSQAYGPPTQEYGPPPEQQQYSAPPVQNYAAPPTQDYGPHDPVSNQKPQRRSGMGPRRRRGQGRRIYGEVSSSSSFGLGRDGGGGGQSKKMKSKDKGKGETIWLESSAKFPGSSSSSSSGGGYILPDGKIRRSGYDGGSSSSGAGKGDVYLLKPKSKGGCYCSIGRREKGDDAALITLGSIGIPLAITGVVLGGALGQNSLQNVVTAITDGITNIITAIQNAGRRRSFVERSALLSLVPMLAWPITLAQKAWNYDWKVPAETFRSMHDSMSVILWKFATKGFPRASSHCGAVEARDLGSDMEFIDENEIVLRMLDDLMMTYKYGYVPKCTRSHICKLNKAAASGGQPQSTIVPLMSLPAAWLLGKPSSNVMDFLHAVWLGRNEKDCDEVYPECSDIYSSLRFRGGGANSTDTELEADLHMDELLNDLRYLEENNQMAPAAETNQDRKEDDPKEEKTT